MNTIRNYLENMFLGLPQNNDVKRAKEELLGMMEDKYQQLKNEGKTENEAIGIIISEFGNLDELGDVLGIKGAIEQKANLPLVSYERAAEYIEDEKLTAPKTALGVWLCIMSPVVLFTLLGLHESNFINGKEDTVIAVGIFVLISIVAVAVSFFIRYSSKLEKYDDLKKNSFSLDYKTEQMVRNVKKEEEPIYRSAVSISVIGYIISVLPVILTSLIVEEGGIHILALVVTIVIVAFSTYNIINKNGAMDACKVLLQEEEYSISKKQNKNYKVVEQVYWLVIVAVYLGYSFITNDWHMSWIIWPVAGVLFAAVRVIMLR